MRADWIAVGVISLIGLALRWWLAHRLPFEIDEGVSQGYDSLWREFDGRETVMNPPLYRVLSFPISSMTLGSPAAGRIVAVLLSVPLIVLMARLAAQSGGRLAALLAALLAAFHPALVLATVYHRSYAPLVVFTAASLLAAKIALKSGRGIDRYILAACLGATFLSHYFGAAIVVGVALWVLIAERSRLGGWIGPAALLSTLCLPFVPAALSGAHAKENSSIGISGNSHAVSMLLSLPGVVAGLLPLRLETPVYLQHSWIPPAVAAAAFAFILIFGARRAPAFLVICVLATFLPAIMAVHATTIREFHAVAAAVPFVILCTVAAGNRRWLAVLGTLALLPLFLTMLPARSGNLRGVADVAADAIRAEPAHWPVFVWGAPEPGFTEVALQLGLTRVATDLTTEGTDERIRALRSCSTAAVREAARGSSDRPVRIAVLHDSCAMERLNGRGIACSAAQALEGVSIFDCKVDPTSIRSVPLPSRLPENIARRVDRAIPPGHEEMFKKAVLPFALGVPDFSGVKLWGVRVAMDYVQYELKPADGSSVIVTASPTFSDDSISGTEFTVSPESNPLMSSVKLLESSFTSHVTPAVWSETYGLVTNGQGGHTPIPFKGWLWAWGAAIAVLGVEMIRRKK